jgi:hypothetical protein
MYDFEPWQKTTSAYFKDISRNSLLRYELSLLHPGSADDKSGVIRTQDGKHNRSENGRIEWDALCNTTWQQSVAYMAQYPRRHSSLIPRSLQAPTKRTSQNEHCKIFAPHISYSSHEYYGRTSSNFWGQWTPLKRFYLADFETHFPSLRRDKPWLENPHYWNSSSNIRERSSTLHGRNLHTCAMWYPRR